MYLPTSFQTQAPVIVFFYGGSWKSGSRRYYRFIGEAFARLGFVVVIPDYRLYPEVRFPVFVEDAAAAVRWVRDTIAGSGGDPHSIVLMGHSAGAHIAALLAADARYLQQAGVPANSVRGFVGLAGPYGFDPFAYDSTRPVFQSAESPRATQPLTFVDGDEPSMLLLHGIDDVTVFPKNSRRLAERVTETGGEARYIAYPGRGHIGLLLSLAAPFRDRDAVYRDVVAFLATLSVSPEGP